MFRRHGAGSARGLDAVEQVVRVGGGTLVIFAHAARVAGLRDFLIDDAVVAAALAPARC